MDLSTLNVVAAAETGEVMTLKHPVTGDDLMTDDPDGPKPQTITLRGSDSEAYRKRSNAIVQQRSKRARAGRLSLSVDEVEEGEIEVLVAATAGWNLWINGESPTFSAAAARELYATYPWIKEQAQAFVGERANFLKSSAKR